MAPLQQKLVLVSNKREKPINDRRSRQQEVTPAGTSMRYEASFKPQSGGMEQTFRLDAQQYHALTVGYTTLVTIEQTAPAISYWSLPSMTVRLYHDAMVAEVCSSQQIFRFKARYDYPNKKLHQRDEKHQINQFLADWLRYCLAHGAMAIPVY